MGLTKLGRRAWARAEVAGGEQAVVSGRSGLAHLDAMSTRKREIICSLASSFARRGYHAVGMRELAQTIGLNQGTLYHHFPSKDHALLAVCLIGQDETHRIVVEIVNETRDFSDRITLLFERYLEGLDKVGDFIDVFANQRDALPAELEAPLRAGWRKTRQLYLQIFDDALADGAISSKIDRSSAVLMLVGVYRMTNMLHRMGRRREIGPFIDVAVRVLLDGFRRH